MRGYSTSELPLYCSIGLLWMPDDILKHPLGALPLVIVSKCHRDKYSKTIEKYMVTNTNPRVPLELSYSVVPPWHSTRLQKGRIF